jgi:hypothetical protein
MLQRFRTFGGVRGTNDILTKLKGGDRRSIGKSGEAAKDVSILLPFGTYRYYL